MDVFSVVFWFVGVSLVIIFSMRLKMVFSRGRSGPSAVSISRRLLMSAVSNVLVSMAVMR